MPAVVIRSNAVANYICHLCIVSIICFFSRGQRLCQLTFLHLSNNLLCVSWSGGGGGRGVGNVIFEDETHKNKKVHGTLKQLQ